MAKRILIYTNHYYPEQFKVNDVVDWLNSLGYELRVVTCIPNYPSGKFYKGYNFFNSLIERKNNVIINRLPLIPRGNGNTFMLVLNYLSYFISCLFFTLYLSVFVKKYDFILVHHTSPLFIAINPILYGLFKKSKKVLWDLDIWPETLEAVEIIKKKRIINFLKKVVSYIYSYYDTILISSLGLERIIRERFDGRIEYFPNWADQLIEKESNNLRVNINVPKNHKVIMYTGNIGYAQNLDTILKICYKTINENLYWVFVGDGRFKHKISQAIVNNPKLKIRLINSVKADLVKSYLEASDFALLSLSSKGIFNKTVPAKLQTYMCLSKAVIGMINGEGKEIIMDANCGIVIDSTKIDNSVEKIIELINYDKLKIQNLGENGKKYYYKHFHSKLRKRDIKNILK